MFNSSEAPCGGKLVAIKLYGTETHALPDTAEVINLISWDLCQNISLTLMDINRQVGL